MLAIFAVLMVLVPITWVLFRNGGRGMAADNEAPYVEWVDDRYQSAKPTVADWTTTEPTLGPSGSPTETPSDSPTSTPTPSTTPTDELSTTPTTSPSDHPTSRPTSPGQTRPPTTRPTNSPTTPPPSPPSDDGNMNRVERELYDLIGGARADHGCGPLRPDSNLSGPARQQAAEMAEEGEYSSDNSSEAVAGAKDDDLDARAAFDQMMRNQSGTVLNCGLTRLGVGQGTHKYCSSIGLGGLCLGAKKPRSGWVADFA